MQGSVSVKGRACGLVLAGQGVGGCGGEVGRGAGESGTITNHINAAFKHRTYSQVLLETGCPDLNLPIRWLKNPTTAVHCPPTQTTDLDTASRADSQAKALWEPRSPRLLPRLPGVNEHPDMLGCG